MNLNKKILKYILSIFIGLAALGALLSFNSRLSGAVFKISAPLVRAGNGIHLSVRSLFMISQINRENIKLSRENAELSVKVSKLDELEKENSALKKILGIPVLSEKRILKADITGFSPFDASDCLTINKGKRDGIEAGMPAVSEEGALLGKIEEALDNFSKITLIFSSRSSVAVLSQSSRSSGIVKGNFGTSLVLDMVPQLDLLREGEILITSGIGGIFPKGIPIGKVGRIDAFANDVFKKASVYPLIDLHKIESAIVILDGSWN